RTKGASDHFVLSAAIVPAERLVDAVSMLADLRSDTGRRHTTARQLISNSLPSGSFMPTA
ncbi:MAG: hypothetical protein QOD82_5236, partial [Pseudonocardiales bacterium]|nr:hypothetical protein [Pseudonocardiales bacterium]